MASELKDTSNDPVMDVEMSKPENEVVEQLDECKINVTNTGKFDETMNVNVNECESQCEEEVVKRMDEYSFLETDGFSNERFKVEIRNMPKSHGINVAQPTPDPFIRKRKLMEASGESTDQKKSKEESVIQEEKIKKNNTTPYWNKPYEEQLATKQQEMYRLIQKFTDGIWLKQPELRGYIEAKKKIYSGLICQYDNIKSVKKTEGYRNKYTFKIGMDDEAKLPTVGFRIGSYVTGFIGVAPVDKLCHISDEMKRAVLLFQDFVRSSDLKVYSPVNHSGNWNSLMIRQSSSTRDLMLVFNIFSQGIDEDKLSNLKSSLVKHFSSQEAADLKISSLYYQPVVRSQNKEPLPKPEHFWGEIYIYETILGIEFRISPGASFPINTKGAEILYQTAIDMAEPKQDTTVVDICCGTGTIGLCFSKHCNQVLAVESVSEAVEDAKFNATANNITNAEFFLGLPENILYSIVKNATNQDVIAVIDQPRAGLNIPAVRLIRGLEQIKKLVFVSPDHSNAAMKKFLDYSGAESKTMLGDPFILTKAVAVDMFPHIKRTELVLLFERMSPKDFPEKTQMLATSQLISKTPANIETQKKTGRMPRTRKNKKSIVITNTRRMIESHDNKKTSAFTALAGADATCATTAGKGMVNDDSSTPDLPPGGNYKPPNQATELRTRIRDPSRPYLSGSARRRLSRLIAEGKSRDEALILCRRPIEIASGEAPVDWKSNQRKKENHANLKLSETPANTETQKKNTRKPKNRKKKKSIVITNTRKMIESHGNKKTSDNHSNLRKKENHVNQKPDNHSNQRADRYRNHRPDNHSNQRTDNHSDQKPEICSNQRVNNRSYQRSDDCSNQRVDSRSNQKNDNRNNQRYDDRSNQRNDSHSNQRNDDRSSQRNDNHSNQSTANYRNDCLNDQRYYKDQENLRCHDDGNLQRNYNAHYNERTFDDNQRNDDCGSQRNDNHSNQSTADYRNDSLNYQRYYKDHENLRCHDDGNLQRNYNAHYNERTFDDRRNIVGCSHRRMSDDERNIDIHSNQRIHDDRSNQRIYDDLRNDVIHGNQISYDNCRIPHNDDMLNSILSSVKKPVDEAQTFGDFIVTSLRNMKTEESRRLLKRKIQRAVLDVEELEAIDTVQYPAQSSPWVTYRDNDYF